jgi:uncharacterized membrane protein
MATWTKVWLILHILSIIIAFGPTPVFGIIAAAIQKEPQYALFGVKINNAIESKLVLPAFTLAPLFGVLLIFSGHHDFWKSTWLLISVPVFAVAWSIGFFVNRPIGHKLKEKLEAMMAGTAGPETMVELQALGKRAQMFGIILSVLFLVVLVLMIWKPGLCSVGQTSC